MDERGVLTRYPVDASNSKSYLLTNGDDKRGDLSVQAIRARWEMVLLSDMIAYREV